MTNYPLQFCPACGNRMYAQSAGISIMTYPAIYPYHMKCSKCHRVDEVEHIERQEYRTAETQREKAEQTVRFIDTTADEMLFLRRVKAYPTENHVFEFMPLYATPERDVANRLKELNLVYILDRANNAGQGDDNKPIQFAALTPAGNTVLDYLDQLDAQKYINRIIELT